MELPLGSRTRMRARSFLFSESAYDERYRVDCLLSKQVIVNRRGKGSKGSFVLASPNRLHLCVSLNVPIQLVFYNNTFC